MDARLHPPILQQSLLQNRLDYLLDIPSDLDFFPGHFPGFPILPGFIQIGWVMELAGPLNPAGQFVAVNRLKFMRPITCNRQIRLSLEISDDRLRILFRYYTERFSYSSGQIVLGP